MFLGLILLLTANFFSSPTPVPVYWLEIARRQTPTQARKMADRFHLGRHRGNRIREVLIVDPQSGAADVRVWLGPFSMRQDAFRTGLRLLGDPSLAVPDFSIRRMDGAAVSLQMPGALRKQLSLPDVMEPWPQIGISLMPHVTGYARPMARLPRLAHATVTLGYRDEVWIQGEQEICEDGNCRRWFHAVTPAPHRLAWFPAGQIAPVDNIRGIRSREGKLEQYTAVVQTGRTGDVHNGVAMVFLGNRRPQRWTFQRRGFYTGRLVRQENNQWAVHTPQGVIPLPRNPAWLPVDSLFSSSGRRQFF